MGNRKHERKRVSHPVRIAFDMEASNAGPLLGLLYDISEGGAGIEIEAQPHALASQIADKELPGSLTVLIPDSAKAETLQVEAVWAKTQEARAAVRMGLRFRRHPEISHRVQEVMRRLPLRPKPLFA